MRAIKTIIFLNSLLLASHEALSKATISSDNVLNDSKELQKGKVNDTSISYEDNILYTEQLGEKEKYFRDIDFPIDYQEPIPQQIEISPQSKGTQHIFQYASYI